MPEKSITKTETTRVVDLQEVKYVPNNDKKCSEFKPEQKANRSDTFYLIFSVLTSVLLMMVGGSGIVWPSSAVLKLKSNDSEINPLNRPITTLEISLLIGLPSSLTIIGSFFLPFLADKIGRKRTLQIIGLGLAIGGVGLAFSHIILLMTTFNSISAIFFGGLLAVLPIYLTEICEDHNRVKFGSIMSGFLPLGQLYGYIIGPFFNLRNFTLIMNAPLILFFVLFCFAPESPAYSLAKGKKEECVKTLTKLRSNKTKEEIDLEYYKISQSLSGLNKKKKGNFFTIFKSKESKIGLLLGMLPLFIQYFCGVPIMMPLLAPIFNDAGISISGSTVAIIIGIFKVICYTVTSLIVERMGRRRMLIFSSFGASIPITALGIYFYLHHVHSPIVLHIKWLPVASMLFYILFYSLGLGPITIAIIGELFPTDIRSSAFSFITSVAGLAISIYAFVFPFLAEMLGTHWCLWIFGMTCFGGGTLFYLFLPETKGKSINEIQEMLKNY